jgi:hypothetical protein
LRTVFCPILSLDGIAAPLALAIVPPSWNDGTTT